MTETTSITELREHRQHIDDELRAIEDSDDVHPDDVTVTPRGGETRIHLTWTYPDDATDGRTWAGQHENHSHDCRVVGDVTDADRMESRTYPDRMQITLVYEMEPDDD